MRCCCRAELHREQGNRAPRSARINSSTERGSDDVTQNGSQTTGRRRGKTRQESFRRLVFARLRPRRRLFASPEPGAQPYGQPTSHPCASATARDLERPSAEAEPKRSNLNAARTPPPQQKKCGSSRKQIHRQTARSRPSSACRAAGPTSAARTSRF